MSKTTTAEVMASVIGKLDAVRTEVWTKADVSVMQMRVLRYVEANPGAANMNVAEGLGVTRPSISAVLERLDQRGLITREISKRDRRGIEIGLTKEGAKLLQSSKAEIKAATDLLGPLNDAELDRLEKLLEKALK